MKSLVLLGIGAGLGLTAVVAGLMRHAPAVLAGAVVTAVTVGVGGADRSRAHEAPPILRFVEVPASGPQCPRSLG